ncbi:DUF11 domain-containing protein [Streptomyces sp. NBC_01239]|uniref:DUF7927 domain-containing protein n=1 Tax=Streptomyces sp. NBC_01239 TaxID=2903792 RepID=UPI002250525E|nr:hypothetical protein [Streptomyces sp. NBC_01239]MCX4809449.1 DUF11 domain-containing protein [Streptomyces sp. NBC_01239]
MNPSRRTATRRLVPLLVPLLALCLGAGAPPTASRTAITVTETASQPTYQPGGRLRFTVVVANAGPARATGLWITAAPPPELHTQSPEFTRTCTPTGRGTTCGTAPGTAAIAPHGTLTYTLTGTVPPSVSGELTASAVVRVSATATDAHCRPVCRASVTVGGPRVHIRTTAATEPGGTVALTTTLDNMGSGDARRFRFTDDLRDVLDDAFFIAESVNSGPPEAGSGMYDARARTVTWTGAVPVGQAVTVTYRVRLPERPQGNGVLTNRVTAPGTNCAPDSSDAACTTTTS